MRLNNGLNPSIFSKFALGTNAGCVIRCKPATDSDAIRPPIPTEVGHPFRSKPATLLRSA